MKTKLRNRFFELLNVVVERPAMFGIAKVEDIQILILGYTACSAICGDDLSDFTVPFRQYVNKHLDSTKDHDWSRLIRFYSASDSHSIELFKKLYKEFIGEKES